MSLRILNRLSIFDVKLTLFKLREPKIICNCAQFSNKPSRNIVLSKDLETGEVKKKKIIHIPKITLLNNNQVDITTLEEAQKLAKRRNLKLIKIDEDTKSQRPVYQLISDAEYLKEIKNKNVKSVNKTNSPFKGEKLLLIGHNISQHDLQHHIVKIQKWLSKKHQVKITVSGDAGNSKKAEEVFTSLEDNIKDHGRILQKRQKGTDIKFSVQPLQEEKDKSDTKELKTEA